MSRWSQSLSKRSLRAGLPVAECLLTAWSISSTVNSGVVRVSAAPDSVTAKDNAAMVMASGASQMQMTSCEPKLK